MSEYRPGEEERTRFAHPRVLARLRDYLATHTPCPLQMSGFRPSAVAVVLLDIDGLSHVILTQRSAKLRAHSGQVSFPGGARDPEDRSAADTATRECREEIGVPPDSLEVLGPLDDWATPSGYVITPVLAASATIPQYQPNRDEVAAVFEAPLSLFADPTRAISRGFRQVGPLSHPLRTYHHGSYAVTGATAHILETLCQLVA